MKTIVTVTAGLFFLSTALGQGIVVQKLRGDVSVRHGVIENWTMVRVGDVLKPDDTMKTGKKGSATLEVSARKRILLPAEVMVDMSDIRDLTQEELMLKLAMERVRASSYRWKSDELNIPNVTVVHGADKAQSIPLSENDPATGVLRLNGARVLFNNGFYSTSALRALDVFRLWPVLGTKFENRILVAQALEKENLRGEALNEYVLLSKGAKLTADQLQIVTARINQLKKESR